MVKVKYSVIAYVLILSALLLVPTLAIRYVDHDARESWERRKLTEMPLKSDFLKTPKAAFAQFDEYMNDHAGGSFQAIKFRKNFHHNYLGETGDKYVTRSNEGAMFLTAPFTDKTRDDPFAWWRGLCVKQQEPKQQRIYAAKVKESYDLLSSRGAKVVFTSVPTKPGLIPQQASPSTPAELKQACLEYSQNDNPLAGLKERLPELMFFYPNEAFRTRMSDPLFYPNKAYHWSGESGWVFMEMFSEFSGISRSSSWDYGPCTPQMVNWDIGRLTGVARETMGCDRDFEKLGIIEDLRFQYPVDPYVPQIDDALKNPITGIRMTKFENPNATNDLTGVMLSNSFGRNGAVQFASMFKTSYHMSTNGMSVPKLRKLYMHSDFLDVDYIITVAGDFHYPTYLNNVRIRDYDPQSGEIIKLEDDEEDNFGIPEEDE